MTTGFLLTAAVPAAVPLAGASIRVGNSVTPLHAAAPADATRTELYAGVASWTFPVRVFGDDAVGAPPPSELDITGNTTAGVYNLVNWYFRNFPARIRRLPFGYSEVWQLAMAHFEETDSPNLMYYLCRVIKDDDNWPEERMWTYHKFISNEWEFASGAPYTVMVNGVPHLFDEGDGDADVPALPYAGLTGVLWAPVIPASTSYVSSGSYPYMVTCPEDVRELYERYYPGVDPGLNYAFHNATRLDVLRARIVAHEFMHSFSDLLWSSGSLPARGDGVSSDYWALTEMHDLPGITCPFFGDDVGNTPRFDNDPVLAANVQMACMLSPTDSAGGTLRESDTPPYLIWHARRHVYAPSLLRP